MATYLEILLEVDDYGVKHIKEEWPIEEESMFTCTTCEHTCLTSASLALHCTTSHASRGYDSLQAVYNWFSL